MGDDVGPAMRTPVAWTAAAVAGALVALAAVAFLHRLDASDHGFGPGLAALAVAVVAALALLASSGLRHVGPWVAAAGVAVTLAGSGVGRWSDRQTLTGGGGGGDIVARAQVTWPLVALGLALAVAGLGLAAARSAGVRPVAASAGLLADALGLAVLAVVMGEVVVGGWIEGRPRRRRGRLVATPSAAAGPVGELWAKAARDEAAAVDAFTDLAVRLAAVGAPPDLVARSRDAAADEVRHARACHRLAVRHGAPAPSSSPEGWATRHHLRPRRVELVRLAVESCVDGVVGEGLAAGRMERAARHAPDLAPTLTAIARDERAHAALGADVIAWCASQARIVRPAVRAAARRLPLDGALPSAHAAHDDAVLRSAGLVDRAGAAAVWRDERATAVATLDGLLARGQARGFGPAA